MPHEIEVAPDQIVLPTQVRLDNSAGFAAPVLRELGENLRVRQISAVGIRRHETEKNLYIAVYGFRRIRAALLVMLPTIRALVLEDGLSASEIKMRFIRVSCG